MIYSLCNGDFTKFTEAKKMKVSEAGVIMILKEKENFLMWYTNNKS